MKLPTGLRAARVWAVAAAAFAAIAMSAGSALALPVHYFVVAELPIPDPGSLLLLGSGCALLAWGRLRSSGSRSQSRRESTAITCSARIAR